MLFLLSSATVVQEPGLLANAISPFISVATFVATIVGLVGLCPWVKASAARLAFAGVLTAALALLAVVTLLVVMVGSHLLLGTPIQSDGAPPAATVLFLLTLISTGVSFLLYGVASLRAETTSPAVGVVMMVPVLAWPGYALVEQVLGLADLTPLIVFAIVALALLVVGNLLRTPTPTGRVAPSFPSEPL